MAYDCVWIATGSGAQDYSAAGSWTGGVPLAAESALIGAGDIGCAITSGMDQSAVDITKLTVGTGFRGTIGTASSPLIMGTVTDVEINAPKSPSINIQANDGDTVTNCKVYACSTNNYGVHLNSNGAGAWTNLYVLSGGIVRIGAAYIGTNVFVMGNATAIVETGASVTNYYVYPGADVRCSESTITLADLYGGRFEALQTDAAGTLATLNVYPTAKFVMNCKGMTVTNVYCKGGTIDGTQVDHENTFTASEAWQGSSVHLNQQTILTGNMDLKGTVDYKGPSGVDIDIPDVPAP